MPCHPPCVYEGETPLMEIPSRTEENILICGWRRDIRDMIYHLDATTKKGSKLNIMTPCVPIEKRNDILVAEGLDFNLLKNLKIVHLAGVTSCRRKIAEMPLDSYSSCMIFSDEAVESDTMHADSHAIATLILIRDLQD